MGTTTAWSAVAGTLCLILMQAGCSPGGTGDAPGAPAPAVRLRLIASGLTAPVALVSPADGSGRLFVAGQTGLIRIIDADGTLRDDSFLDLSERMVTLNPGYDERGLLGLALHPDYVSNGRFFVYYSALDEMSESEIRISIFAVSDDANRADPDSEVILLRVKQPQSNHNGGQLAFGPDGYLYAGIGDGGGANDDAAGHTPGIGNAQDLSTLLGKIIRIDVDSGSSFSIPEDNPFVDRAGARPEIYAYGLRNPWRFSFDFQSGRLFCGDVGQNRLEEIDIIEFGGNYGWRIREANTCFDPDSPNSVPASCARAGSDGAALIDPILQYDHGRGISVIGGFVYRGQAVPALRGAYVFGDFSSSLLLPRGQLFNATEDAQGVWTMARLAVDGRLDAFLFSIATDTDGELYVLTNGVLGTAPGRGAVYRIEASAQ